MRHLNYNIKIICVCLISATILQIAFLATPASSSNTTAPKILITEIFPNPKGKDENKEWIEIFNNEDEAVNLDDWQISQTSTGKKKSEKFQIKNLKINAKSYAVISGKNLKKSLRNKENTLALLSPSSESVVKIYYKASEEGKSFSLTRIIDTTVPTAAQPATKYVWRWTFPSKGGKIKDFYYMEGKISSSNDNTFTFSINQNGFLKPKNQPKSLHVQTFPTAKSSPLINQILHKYIKKPADARKKLNIQYQNINPLLLKIFSKQKTTLKILAGKENNKLILIKIIRAN